MRLRLTNTGKNRGPPPIVLYQITHESREKLALALPDGQAIIIETAEAPKIRRRRIDPATKDEA